MPSHGARESDPYEDDLAEELYLRLGREIMTTQVQNIHYELVISEKADPR